MAGIYIHVPFCKKACHYCDFHFSTSLKSKNELIQCLLKEIELRKEYLNHQPIESIYFGGGTPSLLSDVELQMILQKIYSTFNVLPSIECTLEANPDDLTFEKIKLIRQLGVNRLSIGVQSFFEEDLIFMNRSHNAIQAISCIEKIREGGFDNFSIDLIFGYPLLSDSKWKQNIDTALKLNIPHLSCYAMTVEPKTALASFIKTKKTPPINHEQSATQFEYLMSTLEAHSYEHYEISNYALKGSRAVHNSNYWKGIPYLGIGPSSHSFDGISRQWNVSNNASYIKSITEGKIPFEKEILNSTQQLNERIMTSLRTMEGLQLSVLDHLSISERAEWNSTLEGFVKDEMIEVDPTHIRLTRKGKLFADYIAGELFV